MVIIIRQTSHSVLFLGHATKGTTLSTEVLLSARKVSGLKYLLLKTSNTNLPCLVYFPFHDVVLLSTLCWSNIVYCKVRLTN